MSAELIAHRKRLVDEWNAYRAKCRRELAEERHDLGKGRQKEVRGIAIKRSADGTLTRPGVFFQQAEEQEEIAIETEEVLDEVVEVLEE